jgi:energy-converting hydrogenase B subunit D
MIYLVFLLGVIMVLGAIGVLFQKTLRAAALITGVVSLIAAGFFVFMKAYDVAITEASIGAVLSTALYFFALKRIESLTPAAGRETRGGVDDGEAADE